MCEEMTLREEIDKILTDYGMPCSSPHTVESDNITCTPYRASQIILQAIRDRVPKKIGNYKDSNVWSDGFNESIDLVNKELK